MKKKKKNSIGLCNCSFDEFQEGVEFIKETDSILDDDIFLILKRVCSFLFYCVKNNKFDSLLNYDKLKKICYKRSKREPIQYKDRKDEYIDDEKYSSNIKDKDDNINETHVNFSEKNIYINDNIYNICSKDEEVTSIIQDENKNMKNFIEHEKEMKKKKNLYQEDITKLKKKENEKNDHTLLINEEEEKKQQEKDHYDIFSKKELTYIIKELEKQKEAKQQIFNKYISKKKKSNDNNNDVSLYLYEKKKKKEKQINIQRSKYTNYLFCYYDNFIHSDKHVVDKNENEKIIYLNDYDNDCYKWIFDESKSHDEDEQEDNQEDKNYNKTYDKQQQTNHNKTFDELSVIEQNSYQDMPNYNTNHYFNDQMNYYDHINKKKIIYTHEYNQGIYNEHTPLNKNKRKLSNESQEGYKNIYKKKKKVSWGIRENVLDNEQDGYYDENGNIIKRKKKKFKELENMMKKEYKKKKNKKYRKEKKKKTKTKTKTNKYNNNNEHYHYLYKALCDFVSTKYKTNKLLKYMDENRDMYSWKPPSFYWKILKNQYVVKEILKLYEERYLDPFLSCLYEDFMNKFYFDDNEKENTNNITTYTSNFNIFTLRISEEIQKFLLLKEPEEEEDILNICKNICVSENSYIYAQLILEYIYRNNNDNSMRRLSQYLCLYILYKDINIYNICNNYFSNVIENEISISYLIFKINNLHNYHSLYNIFKNIYMIRNKGCMHINNSDIINLYNSILRVLKVFNGQKLLLFDSTYMFDDMNRKDRRMSRDEKGKQNNSIYYKKNGYDKASEINSCGDIYDDIDNNINDDINNNINDDINDDINNNINNNINDDDHSNDLLSFNESSFLNYPSNFSDENRSTLEEYTRRCSINKINQYDRHKVKNISTYIDENNDNIDDNQNNDNNDLKNSEQNYLEGDLTSDLYEYAEEKVINKLHMDTSHTDKSFIDFESVNFSDNKIKSAVSEFLLPSASQYGRDNYNYDKEFLRINIYAEKIPLIHMRDIIFINNLINIFVNNNDLFSNNMYKVYGKVLIFLTTYSPYEYVYNQYYSSFFEKKKKKNSFKKYSTSFFDIYDDRMVVGTKDKKIKKKKKKKKKKKMKKKKIIINNNNNIIADDDDDEYIDNINYNNENNNHQSYEKSNESSFSNRTNNEEDKKTDSILNVKNSNDDNYTIKTITPEKKMENNSVDKFANDLITNGKDNVTSLNDNIGDEEKTNSNSINNNNFLVENDMNEDKERNMKEYDHNNKNNSKTICSIKNTIDRYKKEEECPKNIDDLFEIKTEVKSCNEIKSSVFLNIKSKQKLKTNKINKKKKYYFYKLFHKFRISYNNFIKYTQNEIFHIYQIIHGNYSDVQKDKMLIRKINSNLAASIIYKYIYNNIYEYINNSKINLIYPKFIILKYIVDKYPQKRYLTLHFLKELYIFIIEKEKALEEYAELRGNIVLFIVYMIRYENMFCYVVNIIKTMIYVLDKSLIRLFIMKTLTYCAPPYDLMFCQCLLNFIYSVLKKEGIYYKDEFKKIINKFLDEVANMHQMYQSSKTKELFILSNYIRDHMIQSEKETQPC
ncbi:conserved Plasmodium protein, unknown function [Plasmodium sp. DRC-Itaito]|nr:conserved Plasmodium protein, unknown function [Plasmodium sp. DRC-Itaito]